jgi:hypothetical protein
VDWDRGMDRLLTRVLAWVCRAWHGRDGGAEGEGALWCSEHGPQYALTGPAEETGGPVSPGRCVSTAGPEMCSCRAACRAGA